MVSDSLSVYEAELFVLFDEIFWIVLMQIYLDSGDGATSRRSVGNVKCRGAEKSAYVV